MSLQEGPPPHAGEPPPVVDATLRDVAAPPADVAAPPADVAAPPADVAAPPADVAAPPADVVAPSADVVVPTADKHEPPADTHAPPADVVVPTADKHEPPADTHAPPVDVVVPTADKHEPPADTHAPPADVAAPPADVAAPPADVAAPPADTYGPLTDVVAHPADAHAPANVVVVAAPLADVAAPPHLEETESANSHMTEDQLRKQNSDTLEAMTRLQALAVEQKVQANLAMTSLRTKLRRRDNELKLIKSQNEQQMLSVLSRLLFLEGHMQKEHKEIVEILQDKDDVIRRQKAAIADLTQKNERLLQRLRETHGYAGDNGLTKPDNLIVNQAENISIQDHGNKVILRGSKLKNGEKIPSKVRFSAMKERLKRHKSSLELYQSEPLETLVEGGIRYGSQESLVTQNGRPKDFDRKERCRSLMDYPFGLRDVYEHHNESPDSCFGDEFNSPDISHTDSVSSSTSSLVNIGERNGSGGSVVGRPGNRPMMSYGFNELSKSRSVPHALPTVSENDTGSTNFKERPLSLPSVELLAKNLAPSSAGDNTSTKGTKTSLPPPSPTNSSPPSESSAFKSFKNVFKRRGSKKKKSGTGIADGQDSNTETLKQHFKKYNLS